jgi:hypothetical protein
MGFIGASGDDANVTDAVSRRRRPAEGALLASGRNSDWSRQERWFHLRLLDTVLSLGWRRCCLDESTANGEKAQPFNARAVIASAQHNHWTFMAQPIPFSRNTGAARARHAKAMLLPMARQTADDLALRVHLALDALRRGDGGIGDAQTLTQVMLLTGFLAESGFGSATGEQLGAAEREIANVFETGRDTGRWALDESGFTLFAQIATNYDQQLHRAPLWAVTEVSERLDRFTAGLPYQFATRKRA